MARTKLTREALFDIPNYLFLGVVGIAVAYPIYFVIIASFSNPAAIAVGDVTFLPVRPTLDGYRALLDYAPLWRGYANTILYTVTGTLLNVTLTLTGGYVLSRKDLVGRDFFMLLFAFTMVFSGGLVPTYLVVRGLGLINTLWAMILPQAVLYFYLVIARTFFQSTIPDELLDSARMDGCGNGRFFVQIVLPISPALIAIMVLYYAVFHWNAFFNAFLYISERDRYPLQLVLRSLIIQNRAVSTDLTTADVQSVAERGRLAELIKYGAIVVSSVPILVLYPFLQKYFVKGVMIGAIKG
jgi:putative aldouronate transport system permease protein